MSLNPTVTRGKNGASGITEALTSAVTLDSYTVAGAPSAALHTGKLIYCSNGASGAPCLAYSNGTSWLRVLLGVAIA